VFSQCRDLKSQNRLGDWVTHLFYIILMEFKLIIWPQAWL
jgi:hypothetical protein